MSVEVKLVLPVTREITIADERNMDRWIQLMQKVPTGRYSNFGPIERTNPRYQWQRTPGQLEVQFKAHYIESGWGSTRRLAEDFVASWCDWFGVWPAREEWFAKSVLVAKLPNYSEFDIEVKMWEAWFESHEQERETSLAYERAWRRALEPAKPQKPAPRIEVACAKRAEFLGVRESMALALAAARKMFPEPQPCAAVGLGLKASMAMALKAAKRLFPEPPPAVEPRRACPELGRPTWNFEACWEGYMHQGRTGDGFALWDTVRLFNHARDSQVHLAKAYRELGITNAGNL